MRTARAVGPKVRHQLELSWEDVPKDHLDDLRTVISSTFGGTGLVVSPTFQGEARLTAAYSSGTTLHVDDVSSFQAWTITIESGVNDKLDFSEDGTNERTASLTPGSYTPQTLSAHIQAVMDSQVTGPEYSVSYSHADDRFTIAEAGTGTPTGTLELYWFSGTNAASSVGADIGYDVSMDRTGATTYSSNFFKAPYGYRGLLADYYDGFDTTVIRYVSAVDTGDLELTIAETTGHTYIVNSVVEPVFNASIILEDMDGEAAFARARKKNYFGLESASIKLVEEFNA
jgi:hypothetical protein